jgi:hypothetical protein
MPTQGASTQICPHCSEPIKGNTLVCPHCGNSVVECNYHQTAAVTTCSKCRIYLCKECTREFEERTLCPNCYSNISNPNSDQVSGKEIDKAETPKGEYNEYATSSRVFGLIGLLGILGQLIGMNEMMRFLSNRDYFHPITTADSILTAMGVSSALLGIVFSCKGLKSEKVVIARAGRRISVWALILCLSGFLVALIGSFIVYPIEF